MCTFNMALRVLLADESSTIKKVMQLALNDFGVEVKSVPIGLDVPQAMSSFNPDIVFVDILLAKKNGYEVCSEIKSNPATKNIPVVLMWSGFMDIDEEKATTCNADRRLEKPFDADSLRGLVKDLVQSTQENSIVDFLSFPELPEIVEEAPVDQAATTESEPEAEHELSYSPMSSLGDFDEPEEFQSVPLPKSVEPQINPSTNAEDWSRQDLSQFKVNIPADDFDDLDLNPESTRIAVSSGIEEVSLEDLEEILPPAPENPIITGASPAHIDTQALENMVREQVRETLEAIAWKVIPELAERVIREELQKLLKDAEQI